MRAARLVDGGGVDVAADAWKRMRARLGDLARPVEDFGANLMVRPEGDIGRLTAEVDAWREAGGTSRW